MASIGQRGMAVKIEGHFRYSRFFCYHHPQTAACTMKEGKYPYVRSLNAYTTPPPACHAKAVSWTSASRCSEKVACSETETARMIQTQVPCVGLPEHYPASHATLPKVRLHEDVSLFRADAALGMSFICQSFARTGKNDAASLLL